MSRPRFAVLAVVTSCLVIAPCLQAGADPRHPSPADLTAAHKRVTSAQRSVGDLRIRAEAAAETYDEAASRQQQASAASAAAHRRAAAALVSVHVAQARATRARVDAAAADDAAAARRAEQQVADSDTAGARLNLDRLVGAAYRTGGQLTMVTRLLDARSPLEFAQENALVSSVSSYQQDTIERLSAAQRVAADKAALATTAQAVASTAQAAASTTAQQAQTAQDAALTTSELADVADSTAAAAVEAAATAKARAQELVSRAESTLGSAREVAASLVRAAAQARRAAALLQAQLKAQAAADVSRSGNADNADNAAGSSGSSGHQAAGGHGGPASGRAAAQVALSWAFAEVGTPYSWGGGTEAGPTYGFAQGAHTVGFDCSGLTLFAYGHAGIHLDHYTGSQYLQGQRVSRAADLQPGDLMFFATDVSDPATIHHVAIYVGQGQMIEAPHTGDVVKVSPARTVDFIGGTRPWA